MAIDLTSHYVYLDAAGAAATVTGGDAFWSQSPEDLEQYGRGWLVSEYEFAADWPQWEMHPGADEIVRLMSGAAELHLEWPTGIQIVKMLAGDAYVIPKGAWHTVKVIEPCRMLHITMGAGTQHRLA
ncbi:cupin domain-containing protein [Achromobacter mucicolens]|jgi:mannose-6-phosphate isomerase-like protein (cupin superfamily)|uniref:Cupin type-2 domain-containing protein n=1 Tax=Achromobacter mucicolens TaxID=1389922 RepID=A0ABM8L7M5_9BURK|nr:MULTISPECIES: cupin domain-containing protein [Achromobacter]KRB10364.1 cupin [Achromobacter sp. Root170]MCP2517803.1 cupin domain-containing protein [Achromobacter mucicolens]MCU6615803.1 cupin domain-containing protein [Achromobacter mucicolens]MDF2862165.1 cupin [Achromobacter mucicolens]MDH1521090.1 cupin domain-containing protein [Achromobacter mucicolens]